VTRGLSVMALLAFFVPLQPTLVERNSSVFWDRFVHLSTACDKVVLTQWVIAKRTSNVEGFDVKRIVLSGADQFLFCCHEEPDQ
jgi:hypothetical protein